jgi:hypothetical protein
MLDDELGATLNVSTCACPITPNMKRANTIAKISDKRFTRERDCLLAPVESSMWTLLLNVTFR